MAAEKREYQAVIKTPVGKIGILADTKFLYGMTFLTRAVPLINPVTDLAHTVVEQLNQYFINPKFQFHLPLSPKGTSYQQKVWQELCKIAVGSTLTYGQLAQKIASGSRAIGNACRRNPIPIIVPCHRIVSAKSLGGYSGEYGEGALIDIKKWLLQHEEN